MLEFAKDRVKKLAPKLSLQLRVRKLLAGGVEPDMKFLANLPQYLLKAQETKHLASYFDGERVAIDVGACGGEYACVMARYFKKVLVVEPTHEMAVKLRTALPRNCEVLECAMGRTPGSVVLRIPKVSNARMYALSTVASHDFDFSDIGGVDTVHVKQCTIDELIRNKNISPSFVKIDVEGYEGEVLLGAIETIASCRPIFLIEIERRHNSNFREIFSLLESRGYQPFHLQDWKLQRSSYERVDESYACLIRENVSGMAEVILSRASGGYINNFLFLPIASPVCSIHNR